MVTNSIQDLKPGEGNYNFFLSVQGRIQGDANIFAEPEVSAALLIETGLAQVPNLIALLDRYIIMDDVELADISAARAGLLIAGPQAPTLLGQLALPASELAPLELATTTWRTGEVTVLHAHGPIVPRFELWADPVTLATLTAALREAGAAPLIPPALEDLRILEGTPRYGTDIRDRELPQETAQTRALHFAKGCYLGQEIVERIRSRGNVHRTFTAFRLEGALPPAGTALEAESKPIGELTSTSAIPLPNGPVQLALGYIRREALDRNLTLTYPGGTAVPVAVPFSIAAAG
jgi:aminomethyltransferase